MNKSDLQDLKKWLERNGYLPDYQRDLIENAIFCITHGSEYRAELSMKTMVANYRNDGNFEAARKVENVL